MPSHGYHRAAAAGLAVLAAATVVLFALGAISDSTLWLFQTIKYTPVWYLVSWGLLLVGLTAIAYKHPDRLRAWLATPTAGQLAIVGLLAAIAVFHFDSFVAGAGNDRVAQIAQVGKITCEPQEYGALTVVAGVFHVLKMLGLKSEVAGVWGWRVFSILCVALSIFGVARLVRLMAPTGERRVIASLFMLFAGPFLMLCGYIGVEPVVVTTTIWFAAAAYQLSDRFSLKRFCLVWLIVAISLFFAVVTAFLIPAAVCVTVASLWRRNWNWLIGGVAGLASMGVLVVVLLSQASRSVWLQRFLVMPDGKLPLKAYSLQSIANVSDKGMTVLVIAPIGLYLLVLLWPRLQSMTDRIFAATLIVATIAGRSAQVLLDPVNGLVLDFPRFTAFLAPMAIAVAFFVDRRWASNLIPSRIVLLSGVLTLMLPLLLAPTFTKIENLDPLAKAYSEKNDHFYRTTGLAFRDAYFYRKELDQANAWEWSLPIKSPDFLNMRGCNDLVAANRISDALVSVFRLVGRQPYWAEPRNLLVALLSQRGRLTEAKPHLDTCQMLDPHGRLTMINTYRYAQATGQLDAALEGAKETAQRFEGDRDITTDLLILSMQSGQVTLADSVAITALGSNLRIPYAHLILAKLADQKGLRDSAINEYRLFVQMAEKGNPDAELATKRIDELQQ